MPQATRSTDGHGGSSQFSKTQPTNDKIHQRRPLTLAAALLLRLPKRLPGPPLELLPPPSPSPPPPSPPPPPPRAQAPPLLPSHRWRSRETPAVVQSGAGWSTQRNECGLTVGGCFDVLILLRILRYDQGLFRSGRVLLVPTQLQLQLQLQLRLSRLGWMFFN